MFLVVTAISYMLLLVAFGAIYAFVMSRFIGATGSASELGPIFVTLPAIILSIVLGLILPDWVMRRRKLGIKTNADHD